MKSITDEINLAGKIEKITMMELRKNPGEVIDLVSLGKTFILTRSGKEIAIISKPPGVQLSIKVNSMGKISYYL